MYRLKTDPTVKLYYFNKRSKCPISSFWFLLQNWLFHELYFLLPFPDFWDNICTNLNKPCMQNLYGKYILLILFNFYHQFFKGCLDNHLNKIESYTLNYSFCNVMVAINLVLRTKFLKMQIIQIQVIIHMYMYGWTDERQLIRKAHLTDSDIFNYIRIVHKSFDLICL